MNYAEPSLTSTWKQLCEDKPVQKAEKGPPPGPQRPETSGNAFLGFAKHLLLVLGPNTSISAGLKWHSSQKEQYQGYG